MSHKSRLAKFVMAAALVLSVPVEALAVGEGECTCLTPAGPEPIGSVVTSTDIVQASLGGSTGLGPAPAGTALSLGSQLITGPAGTASIVVGTQCSLEILPNSEVTISQIGDNICVQVTQMAAPPVVARSGLGALILIGGGVAAAIGLAEEEDGGGGVPATQND